MRTAEIVVFGSINLDLVFAMDQLPAAGQTRLARSFSMQPGGKGANQAVAARRAGAVVHMVGAVGADALAPLALDIMAGSGVDLAAVRRIPGAATGSASVCTDGQGRNQIAVALGANALLSAKDLPPALLRRDDTLLVQMEADQAEVALAMQLARDAGMQVVLNLAPARTLPEAVLQLAHLLIVNEDEASLVAAQLGCAPTSAALNAALGIGVVRTLGSEGVEATTGHDRIHIVAPKVEVIDTTAAGDCFVGTLAAALCRGTALPDAVARACVAASLACTKPGSQQSLPFAAETDALVRGPAETAS